MVYKILIVEDEPLMRDFLTNALKGNKYLIEAVDNGTLASEKINSECFDIVITDLLHPGISGFEILEAVKKINQETDVIIETAFQSPEIYNEAIKLGAFDCISKPFTEEMIKIMVDYALLLKTLETKNRFLRNEKRQLYVKEKENYNFNSIIGDSEVMINICNYIKEIATHKAAVLIEGESGTGKKLVAKAIHYNSSRKEKPFITLDCAELYDNYAVFVDIVKKRLKLANTGTLLINKVDTLTLTLQSALLNLLEEKKYLKDSNSESTDDDVRVISTTTRNLDWDVGKGYFRRNLYDRLSILYINLPPLRKRKEDIPLLVDCFLKKYCKEHCKNIFDIDDSAMAKLCSYEWKGNVLELEKHIERAVILCHDEILSEHHFQIKQEEPEKDNQFINIDYSSCCITLREMEKRLILNTLALVNDNKTRTAQILGISIRTLRNKLNEYRMEGINIP